MLEFKSFIAQLTKSSTINIFLLYHEALIKRVMISSSNSTVIIHSWSEAINLCLYGELFYRIKMLHIVSFTWIIDKQAAHNAQH